MNQELIQSLSVITEEEQKILAGSADIDRTLYMDREDMVIDSDKLLEAEMCIRDRYQRGRRQRTSGRCSDWCHHYHHDEFRITDC